LSIKTQQKNDDPLVMNRNNYKESFTYLDHDYTSINNAVLLEEQKSRESLLAYRASTWERWGKTACLFSLAISLFLIALWFVTKANFSDNVKIFNLGDTHSEIQEQNKLIENGFSKTDENLNLASLKIMEELKQEISFLKKTFKNKESEVLEKIVKQNKKGEDLKAHGGESVKVNYTVFSSVETESGKVSTGRSYNPENIREPNNQYCYVSTKIDGSSDRDITIWLGSKKEQNNPVWTGERPDLQKHCQFI